MPDNVFLLVQCPLCLAWGKLRAPAPGIPGPEPGAWVVCKECGAGLILCGGGLRLPDFPEFAALMQRPEILAEMARWQHEAARRRAAQRKGTNGLPH